MANFEEAQLRITQARLENSDTLNLGSLGLTTDNLITLMPSLLEIPNLTSLNLDDNLLTTIDNDDDKDYTTILNDLEEKLKELSLYRNPLTVAARDWLDISCLMSDFELSIENITLVNQPLEIIYGKEESTRILEKIVTFNSGISVTPEGETQEVTKSGLEICLEFLAKTPVEGQTANDIYIPSAKYLIDQIVNENTSEEKRNSTLLTIATTLGACESPVKNYLLQNYIGQHLEENGEIIPEVLSLIEREAIEEKVSAELSHLLQGHEAIEVVNGMLQLLYSNDNWIAGERGTLLPKSAYPEFASEQVTDKLKIAFANIVCLRNQEGEFVKNEDGKYILDKQKYRAIIEPYLGKLGIISERVKYVNKYKEKIEEFLKNNYPDMSSEYFDKEDVSKVINTTEREKDLKDLLYQNTDAEIENVYTNFIQKQKNIVTNLANKYNIPKQDGKKNSSSLSELRHSSSKASQTSQRSRSRSLG